MFDLYTKEFLRKSLEKGLINNTHLSIAGDGTPVVTSARERKRRERPACIPLLHPASMHDSHGFIHAFLQIKKFLPDFHVKKLLLDSAHDVMPYYLYCKRKGIQTFIDFNEKRSIKEKYKDDFTIGKDGVPVYKAGQK